MCGAPTSRQKAKTMGKYATLADFANKKYDMTALGPDDIELHYVMQVPSMARRIEIEFDLLPIPEPPLDKKDPFIKLANGQPTKNYDRNDPDYVRAESERRSKLTAWLICESLVEPAVEGDSIEEKIAQFNGFNPWVKAALAQGYNKLTSITEDRVRVRPFRGDGKSKKPPTD